MGRTASCPTVNFGSDAIVVVCSEPDRAAPCTVTCPASTVGTSGDRACSVPSGVMPVSSSMISAARRWT
jgi:hypothetical protein